MIRGSAFDPMGTDRRVLGKGLDDSRQCLWSGLWNMCLPHVGSDKVNWVSVEGLELSQQSRLPVVLAKGRVFVLSFQKLLPPSIPGAVRFYDSVWSGSVEYSTV